MILLDSSIISFYSNRLVGGEGFFDCRDTFLYSDTFVRIITFELRDNIIENL